MKKRQIATFVSIILVIQFLAHFVVYEGVLAVFHPDASGLLALQILWAALTVAFVSALFAAVWVDNFFTRMYYRITAVWQGFLLYFFIASIALIIVEVFTASFSPIIGYILFVSAFVTGVYGVINARLIRIKRVKVEIPNLPETWKHKTAVFISDLHLGQINTGKFAAKVVALVNELNPNIVFIGGDLYDGVKIDTAKIIELLRNLQTTDGVYFITGNHDGFTPESTGSDVAAITSAGIEVLQDAMIDVEGVQIIGVDYRHTAARNKFAEVLANIKIDRSKPSILLKHVPSDVDLTAAAGISFQLSGHTHRAQLWPFSLLTKRIFKGFDYDLKRTGDTQVYTSSGVGTWGPPLRVGTHSEIVVITFN